MTINDEISIIANQLANEGKKPSVALVKTRVSGSVPLPTLISVLKSWQHDPEFVSPRGAESQSEKGATNAIEPKVSEEVALAVEQAIKPLKQELSEIKSLLEAVLAQK